jgi:hypothetical protein
MTRWLKNEVHDGAVNGFKIQDQVRDNSVHMYGSTFSRKLNSDRISVHKEVIKLYLGD